MGHHWYVSCPVCLAPHAFTQADRSILSWCGRVFGPQCRKDGHRQNCENCNEKMGKNGVCVRCDAVARASGRREYELASPAREAAQQEAAAERERQKEEKRQRQRKKEQQRRDSTRRKMSDDRKKEAAEKAKKRKIGAKAKMVKTKARTSGVVKKRAVYSSSGTRKSIRLATLRQAGKCVY